MNNILIGAVTLLLAISAAIAAPAGAYPPEVPPMAAQGRPAILRVTASAQSVPRFGMLELTVDLTATYDNPFDPEQVDLSAEFAAPSGKRVSVPGFFFQPYRNRNAADDSKRPLLDAAGDPCWKIRFTPTEAGAYRYVVRLRNHFGEVAGDVQAPARRFKATPSAAPGFLRVSKANPQYFAFDDGRPFVPVGQNLQNDWPVYKHSRLLAAGGANCARVWAFCHWTWLEWAFTAPEWAGPGDWMRSYSGAGRYNQRIAWIFDDCLERWTRDGLYVMICLGNATGGGELSAGAGEGSWAGNPYNAANGGFLKEPREFWTDARARRLYKQKLRYIVARWGYSPNLWAIEFWNELGRAQPEVVAWHREMAQYLHEIDPNRHLLTTSTWDGNVNAFSAMWDLPEMDFTQGHHYGPLPAMTARIAEHVRRWHKPFVNGEGGGPSPRGGEGEGPADPDAIEFHNSLWAPLLSGSAGATLPWWWRERVEPQDLFPQYGAVARFAAGVAWGHTRPLELQSFSLAGQPVARLSPVLVAPFGADWGSKPQRSRFRIEPDGTVPGIEKLAGELFGHAPGRSPWRNPPTFEVTYPEPGRFVLHVSEVMHGSLEVRLDGKPVPLAGDPGKPGDFAVDVPAGAHEIGLDNTGADLVRFGSLLLTNYRDAARTPDLDVLGRQGDDFAVLWIHNRLRQWPFVAAGLGGGPVGPATARIAGLKDGRYRVEWWDTYKGIVSRTEQVEVRGGVLVLRVPAVEKDVACKIVVATAGG